jgi:hypothetical protein
MSEAETADGDEVPAASPECAAPGVVAWWLRGAGGPGLPPLDRRLLQLDLATGNGFFAR